MVKLMHAESKRVTRTSLSAGRRLCSNVDSFSDDGSRRVGVRIDRIRVCPTKRWLAVGVNSQFLIPGRITGNPELMPLIGAGKRAGAH